MTSYSFQFRARYLETERQGTLVLRNDSTLNNLKKRLLGRLKLLASNADLITVYVTVMVGKEEDLQPCLLPVFCDRDMHTLLKRQIAGGRDIEFLVESPHELAIKKARKKQIKIQFDSEGDIESVESEYEFAVPSNVPYRGKAEVDCVFCGRSSYDKEYLRLYGPMYGPFDGKYYLHMLCAIWAPNVYLSDTTNKLLNVEKEIRRGKKTQCHYCGKPGGVLGCSNRKCRVTAHFGCAYSCGCQLDWDEYQMKCKQCLGRGDRFKMDV